MKTFMLTPVPFMDRFEASGWMHIAPFGEWAGHPSGEFSFSQSEADAVIAKFAEQKNPIPLDYEHQSMEASAHSGPVPGAGFITELKCDPEKGLYGLANLTATATEKVRAGEYAFCSPVFVKNAPDRKTGEEVPIELISVALTNNPFLDGQQPLTFSRRISMTDDKNTQDKAADKTVIENALPPAKEPPSDAPTADAPKADAPPTDGADTAVADAAAAMDLLAQKAGRTVEELISQLLANADAVIKAIGDSSAGSTGGSEDMEEGAEIENARKLADMQVMLTAAENRATEFAKRVEELEVQMSALASLDAEKKRVESDKAKQAEKDAFEVKLNSHVDQLISEGYARKESRPDLIAVFSRDWSQGERLFHRSKVLPIGPSQSGTSKNDSVALSKAESIAVDALCSRGGAYQGDRMGAIKAVLMGRS
jgi:hypothetical protein